MRNNASRDEYVPQHGSRYETRGTPSRGHADARIHVTKIAAIGMLTLVVIILGITAKTYASERMAHSDASTVQTQNKKVSESKATASQTLSTASLKTRLSKADFNDIPSGDTVQTFSLVDDQIPALEDESLAALQDALSQAQELGDVGVVFYDLSSGKGVTYNAIAPRCTVRAVIRRSMYSTSANLWSRRVRSHSMIPLAPMAATTWAGRRCAT